MSDAKTDHYCPICKTNSITQYLFDSDFDVALHERKEIVGYNCRNCDDVVRDIRV